MTTYRIVRRAYSEYTDVEIFNGGYLDAILRAMVLENINKDGEYIVRRMDQPNKEDVGGYVQSGFDYL